MRISTLLKKMGLEDRSIDESDYIEKKDKAFNISFEKSMQLLEEERESSREYLKNALDIKE